MGSEQGKPVSGRRVEDVIGDVMWVNDPDEAVSDGEDYGLVQAKHPSLSIITGVVALVVVSSAMASAVLLLTDNIHDTVVPVLQDIVRVAYQALAVGLLGGLAKQLIDRRMAQQAEALALRDRRYASIEGLVSASHLVDNARLLIRANRSVKTLTEQMNASIVPARTQVRNVAHNLRNWEDAKSPTFPHSARIINLVEEMSEYLMSLIEEYADNKKVLSELQRRAEQGVDQDRLVLLDEIWVRLQDLAWLGDCLQDGETYGEYRENYVAALKLMRGELSHAS
jgi:hypothetical protein